MKHRLIHIEGPFRIIEVIDECTLLEDLKGDCYNPEVNPDIDADVLKRDERKFERHVDEFGVFGYVLEQWNPEIDKGWQHVDSCFGFVGQYQDGAEDYDHYIIDELKRQIKGVQNENKTNC